MTIEEILAQINESPKQIMDMTDEELLKTLEPCISLEPKPLPKTLVEELEDEIDKDCPIKQRKKPTKKEKLNKEKKSLEDELKELENL